MVSRGATPKSGGPAGAPSGDATRRARATPTVTVGYPKPTTLPRTLQLTASISSMTQSSVSSKTPGYLLAVNVRPGDTVRAGQVVALVDHAQLDAQVAQAQATLVAAENAVQTAQAQVSAARAQRVNAEAGLASARAGVVKAEAQLADSQSTYNRTAELAKQGAIAQQNLDDAKAQVVSAQATVDAARAQVAQAQAASDRAAEDVANATIRAPIRGTVLTRDVELGSPVSSILNLGANATLVMTLGNIDQVFVRGKVDEADIGRVRLGQPARIRVETFKDKTFNGKVTQISPMGVEKDNVTNFEVRVSIDNPGKELRANMTANAEIVLEELPDSLIVPEAAVTYDAQKNASVDVVAPGTKTGRKKTPVKLGVGNGTKIQVIDGLKQGDKIVLPS